MLSERVSMETSFERSGSPVEKADDFIKNETQFHLGMLTTEQSHPKTYRKRSKGTFKKACGCSIASTTTFLLS